MIRTAIVGGTGYTGAELLRILSAHPQVELVAVSSRSEAGTAVADLFPSLRGICELDFSDPDAIDYANLDLVFFATPHGVAQNMMTATLIFGQDMLTRCCSICLNPNIIRMK